MPKIELSYENISHKKVSSPPYDVILAVPQSKKYIVWFSFYKDTDVCYLMEYNKNMVGNVFEIKQSFHSSLSLGTMMFGSFLGDPKTEKSGNFIVEDIMFYKGISLKNKPFGEKLGFIKDFFNTLTTTPTPTPTPTPKIIHFFLVVMQYVSYSPSLKEKYIEQQINTPFFKEHCHYPIHHYQHRSLTQQAPYLNNEHNKKNNECHHEKKNTMEDHGVSFVSMSFFSSLKMQQQEHKTIFRVKADLQSDIYHLFICGKNNATIYYDVAYIPNYKTSIFMNNIFRNIKENKNIDFIEESDDEEDFQNTSVDKYVNLEKTTNIECVFNKKFHKWTPVREVSNTCKIVHISKFSNKY